MTRSVVVTGATGALGRVVCERFTASAWDVIGIGGRQASTGDRSSAQFISEVDLTDEGATREALKNAVGSSTEISALVCIAGGFVWGRFQDSDFEVWQDQLRINLQTAFNSVKACLPSLASPASIVFVGADAARHASDGMGAYTASKSALQRLSEALASEHKDNGLRANVVAPSIINTSANREAMPDGDFRAWAQPSEVAEVITFLADDRSSGITGATIPVIGRL